VLSLRASCCLFDVYKINAASLRKPFAAVSELISETPEMSSGMPETISRTTETISGTPEINSAQPEIISDLPFDFVRYRRRFKICPAIYISLNYRVNSNAPEFRKGSPHLPFLSESQTFPNIKYKKKAAHEMHRFFRGGRIIARAKSKCNKSHTRGTLRKAEG
jgi:hypothetical protein